VISTTAPGPPRVAYAGPTTAQLPNEFRHAPCGFLHVSQLVVGRRWHVWDLRRTDEHIVCWMRVRKCRISADRHMRRRGDDLLQKRTDELPSDTRDATGWSDGVQRQSAGAGVAWFYDGLCGDRTMSCRLRDVDGDVRRCHARTGARWQLFSDDHRTTQVSA